MDSSIRREDALLFTSIKMLTKYTLYFVSCQADALISRETVPRLVVDVSFAFT
jgi:hypothetical protein